MIEDRPSSPLHVIDTLFPVTASNPNTTIEFLEQHFKALNADERGGDSNSTYNAEDFEICPWFCYSMDYFLFPLNSDYWIIPELTSSESENKRKTKLLNTEFLFFLSKLLRIPSWTFRMPIYSGSTWLPSPDKDNLMSSPFHVHSSNFLLEWLLLLLSTPPPPPLEDQVPSTVINLHSPTPPPPPPVIHLLSSLLYTPAIHGNQRIVTNRLIAPKHNCL